MSDGCTLSLRYAGCPALGPLLVLQNTRTHTFNIIYCSGIASLSTEQNSFLPVVILLRLRSRSVNFCSFVISCGSTLIIVSRNCKTSRFRRRPTSGGRDAILIKLRSNFRSEESLNITSGSTLQTGKRV